jgi:amino acid permease
MNSPRHASGEQFEKLVEAYIHDAHYTTTTQATCNVIYAIINAGIVMLPFAASVSGVGVFAASVCAACALSGYTSVMLVKMAHDRAVRSYEELGELSFGIKGYYFLSFLQVCFSSLIIIM